MPSTETVEASRDIQRTEARTRDTAELPPADRELNASALDTTETDTDAPETPVVPPAAQPAPPSAEPSEPRIVRSPFDKRRDEIISAYRQQRNQALDDSDDNERDIRTLSMDGVPPELAEAVDRREEPEPAPPPPEPASARAPRPNEQAEPPSEEKKHKLIIRGKETWVTDQELVEHAQKSLAHDDYLAEGRADREEAKRLLERVQQLEGQRMPLTGTHPASEAAQPGEQPAPGDQSTQVDPFREVVKAIQYGDEDQASAMLKDLVSKTVAPMSAEQVRIQRLQTEHQSSMRALEAFTKSHEDIAKDPMAQAAMRATLMNLQREDIKRLGIIPENRIPENPDQLAQLHLQMRTDRLDVRDVPTLLGKALTDYRAWRGEPEPAPQPAPATAQATPAATVPAQPATAQPQPQPQARRVEVSLNREARRAAIPQQPERTVAPRPNPQPPAQAQPKDRADVVKAMQDKRNALRGKITA